MPRPRNGRADRPKDAMRIVLALAAVALVAACNSVTSTQPLFFARDTQGQPQMRPGIWADEATGCDVDTRLPMDKWPDCIDAWVVRPGELLGGRDPGTPPSQWTVYPFVLAQGDPAVLQVAVTESGDPPAKAASGYVYAGVRPLKYDAQGRIVEYKMWPALCGPPPPPDPTGQKSTVMTQAPIEGLVMDKDQQDCVASDQGPVRVSVQKSEHWGDGGDSQGRDHAHWIRDGER
jgi:hypothetical protein